MQQMIPVPPHPTESGARITGSLPAGFAVTGFSIAGPTIDAVGAERCAKVGPDVVATVVENAERHRAEKAMTNAGVPFSRTAYGYLTDSGHRSPLETIVWLHNLSVAARYGVTA